MVDSILTAASNIDLVTLTVVEVLGRGEGHCIIGINRAVPEESALNTVFVLVFYFHIVLNRLPVHLLAELYNDGSIYRNPDGPVSRGY